MNRLPPSHLAKRKAIISAVLVMAFASLLGLQSAGHGTLILPNASALSDGPGLIVPLYAYPGSAWQNLISAKEAYPSVPVIAIINPSNGPGSYQDSNIVEGVQELQAAGITVIGYVDTAYASDSLGLIESQAYVYHTWYGVSGIFWDEMYNLPGDEAYYSNASNYVYSAGMRLSVGNPGAPVTAGYVGTVNVIITYENAGLPLIGTIANWTGGYSRSGFGVISYNDTWPSAFYISQMTQYVNWIYFTGASHQYGSLSSYATSILSNLRGAPGRVTLAVDTVSQSGSPINGLWTVIYSSGGSVLQTGYSPLTFNAVAGATYRVSVSNYGSCVFQDWLSGSKSNPITITPNQSTTLTAVYHT